MMADPSYGRYLAAKRSVDDRALNRHALDRLRDELGPARGGTLRVVEIGAGLGTMVARLLELGIIVQAEYQLLDVDAPLLAEARAWLTRWAATQRLAVLDEGETLRIRGESGVDVVVRFSHAELGAYLAHQRSSAPADLLIASAFLDLVEVATVLPRLFSLVVSQGLFCFTLNFDGETIFAPEHPDDDHFTRVYHRSMDQRIRYGRPAGDSRCGRHLFDHLRTAGATILAAGSSDWVVHAQAGGYPHDEAYFLQRIVETVAAELRQHAEIPADRLDAWLALRRQQIERGELAYVAHQLDFVGRAPPLRVG